MRGLCTVVLMMALGLVFGAARPLQAEAPLGGDAKPEAADDARRAEVLVEGQGFKITVGDLEDQINKQPPPLRVRFREPEQKKGLLDSLVRIELLAAEAERRGFADNPAVQQTVKDGAVQTLVRTEIDDKITAASVPEKDVAAYYEAHPADFHRPEERRASQILVGSEAEANALMSEAQKADMRGFAELARKHSLDDASKLRGGDLSFFARTAHEDSSPRKVPEAIRETVFKLKEIGDVADKPVKLGEQFAIVRYTGERPERHIALPEATGSIRSRLWRERRLAATNALIDRLRKQAKPVVYEERVDWIQFDDMEKRPSGFRPDPAPPKATKAKKAAP